MDSPGKKRRCPHRNLIIREEIVAANVYEVVDGEVQADEGGPVCALSVPRPNGFWSVECLDCHMYWRWGPGKRDLGQFQALIERIIE